MTQPAPFHPAAVRFGQPGLLRIAGIPAGVPTTEPLSYDDAWPTGWYPLGYTDEGSVINYEISTGDVTVAEELDVFARITEGRNASVEVALAQVTKMNLTAAFNGGVVVGDGLEWTFEPPALGAEERVMIGWDANPILAKNDLRFIFRRCLQGGTVAMENRKGTTKQTISVTFQLEKPTNGDALMVVHGAAALNPVP